MRRIQTLFLLGGHFTPIIFNDGVVVFSFSNLAFLTDKNLSQILSCFWEVRSIGWNIDKIFRHEAVRFFIMGLFETNDNRNTKYFSM